MPLLWRKREERDKPCSTDQRLRMLHQQMEHLRAETADAASGAARKGGKCKSCGQHSLLYFDRQTRSADEGATMYYQCMNKSCTNKATHKMNG
jgi:DNA-directed RNA polymerase subunit M/transcription elongation factor TFIIS